MIDSNWFENELIVLAVEFGVVALSLCFSILLTFIALKMSVCSLKIITKRMGYFYLSNSGVIISIAVIAEPYVEIWSFSFIMLTQLTQLGFDSSRFVVYGK